MNTSYPENLTNLHRGEEELRAKSIAFIEASETLSAHVAMIHSAYTFSLRSGDGNHWF